MPTMGEISANRGEWSEIYAFLRLLCDGRLRGANVDLSVDEHQSLRVLRVARHHRDGDLRGERLPDDSFLLCYNGKRKIPRKELKALAMLLLEHIRTAPSGGGAFPHPETEAFLRSIGCVAVKASSKAKKDIDVTVEDNHVGGPQTYGLSLKSELGAAPTLLNASAATVLTYRVRGIDARVARAFEAIGKGEKGWCARRAALLREAGAEIRFAHAANPIFAQNLQLLDDALPEIIGEMLLASVLGHVRPLAAVCGIVAGRNPRQYPDPAFYGVKVRRFLRAVALGMVPATPWSDRDEATGGYLIVRKDGELVAFYVYNRVKLDDYLFSSTIFEGPSTSRYPHMALRGATDGWWLDLCLQIRFR